MHFYHVLWTIRRSCFEIGRSLEAVEQGLQERQVILRDLNFVFASILCLVVSIIMELQHS